MHGSHLAVKEVPGTSWAGLGQLAKDLATGVKQVAPEGHIIVVRPPGMEKLISNYQDFINRFVPQINDTPVPGVTISVVEEEFLPRLAFQKER